MQKWTKKIQRTFLSKLLTLQRNMVLFENIAISSFFKSKKQSQGRS